MMHGQKNIKLSVSVFLMVSEQAPSISLYHINLLVHTTHKAYLLRGTRRIFTYNAG